MKNTTWNKMCTCAVHCVLSPYHEKACCDAPTCNCWCHERDKQAEAWAELEARRTLASGYDLFEEGVKR